MKECAKMIMNYRRLKDIRRCNNFHTIKTEDVAQHSWNVTMLAMALVDEWNELTDNKVNAEIVLRKALLHDTEEAFTSDICWNIKHQDEETNRMLQKAIDQRIDEAYHNAESNYMNYKDLCKQNKQGATGLFVAVADMLELALYCYEEVMMGNIFMYPMMCKAYSLQVIIANDAYQKFDIHLFSCKTFSQLQNTLTLALDKYSDKNTIYEKQALETFDYN